MAAPEYDKVTHASLNGIYVKAQDLDRGHSDVPAPSFQPPGDSASSKADASTHASGRWLTADAESRASDGAAWADDEPRSVHAAPAGADDGALEGE